MVSHYLGSRFELEPYTIYDKIVRSQNKYKVVKNMSKYRMSVSFDEKNFFWIVIDKEKLIKNPTKEDLIGTKLKYYNKTNICDICREENKREGKKLTYKSVLYPKNALHEKDNNGKETDKWICHRHHVNAYERYNPNSQHNLIKSMRDHRVGNQDPNSSNAKGDNSLELACELYGWEDLNKKYDNYIYPLDCYDPKTGLYHQVQGRYYNSIYQWWSFTGLEDEWEKIVKQLISCLENMACFCYDKDGKYIERIYKFPWKEITRVKSISIYKNPSKGGLQNEQYRITDEYELEKANELWMQILENKKC